MPPMPVDLVTATIGVVVKIKGVLEKFRRNNDECGMIYGLVDTVDRDLMLLRDAPIMEDATVRPVMERLKCTLERTAAEAIKCQNSSALVRFFRTDDVAAKLDQLRQDISEKMLGLVLATSVSTNTLVQGIGRRMDQNFELMHQEMHQIVYAAIAALLLPLQSKLELLEQRTADHTTEDARNKNRRETDKTGLIKYSWSALEASLASNEQIGGGHISTVYKGELNKIPVAIKKFGNVNLPARERFVDELRLVSKLQHGNVIEILGHCYEYSESLVQEGNDIRVDGNGHLGFVSRYMPNQSLVRIIELGNQPIDWPSLFRLVQGIAKGVHYLHEQRVVHLDLKPKTILLDHDMTPKINDFGTARELGPSGDKITLDMENVPGTKGYIAPELSLAEPTASTKSDVYSFGVILLETISLMCATSEKGRPRDAKEWLDRTQGTELRDLFDSRLVDGELQLMVATRCVLVGLMCCVPDPAGRPSMQQVVDMLAGSCAEQNGSTNIASSSNTGHGFCWNCDEKPHRPVSCDVAKAWLEENTQQASLDKSLEKAVREMEELKRSWLWNMAATLGIEVMELGFLTEAYEEIAECWRRIRWVEAYGHYCLDPEAEGDRNNKHELFDRLLQEAMDSLERLVVCADHERSMLCATEVEAITETYSASKEKVEDLTRETRQHFEKLMKAAETDFQY